MALEKEMARKMRNVLLHVFLFECAQMFRFHCVEKRVCGGFVCEAGE